MDWLGGRWLGVHGGARARHGSTYLMRNGLEDSELASRLGALESDLLESSDLFVDRVDHRESCFG